MFTINKRRSTGNGFLDEFLSIAMAIIMGFQKMEL